MRQHRYGLAILLRAKLHARLIAVSELDSASFGNQFREWCDKAGLPKRSAHGLRKSAAVRLVEAGCTTKEVQAITGHASLREVERYTKAAEQEKLARSAIARLTESN